LGQGERNIQAVLTKYPGFVNNPNWRGPHAEIGVNDWERDWFTGQTGLAESHGFETEEKK
jgi:hypothetical protein